MSADPYRAIAEGHRRQFEGAATHEWQRIDQGERYCLRCPATSINPLPSCAAQIPIAMTDNRDTLWREADRLARQMKGLSERLFAFRDALKS